MSEISRRDFLKAVGVSATGAALFSGCLAPEHEYQVQSPLLMPEDMVTGLDNWYASLCQQCSAGCGVIVRVVEGRSKKVEGNPNHPINKGKLCVRGQAMVQEVYHPDRITGPMRRTGNRGSGQFQQITWDDAIDELAARLADQRSHNAADSVVMVTEPLRGHLAHVVDKLRSAYGFTCLAYDPMAEITVGAAMARLFGQPRLPDFDIANTNYLLSFGADFLETWGSPVRYGMGYGEFRQGRSRRGYFVHIDPRMSTSAASADEWVPVRPGTEGVLALSMAQVIISERLGEQAAADALTGGAGASALDAFAPERVAEKTGVDAARIRDIARAFARNRPSLAIGGGTAGAYTNGLFNLMAIYSLNFLVDSVGKPGGLIFNPDAPTIELRARLDPAPFTAWSDLAQRIRSKQPRPVNLLLVHGANPVFSLPGAINFRDAVMNIPFVVSFSSFMDETTALADLILPDHTDLERWGNDVPEPGPGYQTVTFQQPTLIPMYDTRTFGDVLLAVAAKMGTDVKNGLPWNTMQEAIRAGAQQLHGLRRGSIVAGEFDPFWNGVLQRGGWWDTTMRAQVAAPKPPVLPKQAVEPTFAGAAQEYPFFLIAYRGGGIDDGRSAHLPWMQAAPDPLTTIVWQTAVLVNPRKAEELGLAEGDIVTVESPNGRVDVPVYVFPAIPPDVVAMRVGGGHTAYGQWAAGKGANTYSILAPLSDQDTGSLAWAATRVRLTKTARRDRVPKLEGNLPQLQSDAEEIVQVTKGTSPM